ncbi:MAG: GDP-mannose 4,6-dehydratase, partial [Candidatus Margulisiibacteriota bacterium]
PQDFVIGSGKTHSVLDFVRIAFEHVGLDHSEYVEIDKTFIRPAEVEYLVANAEKAEKTLKWKPKMDFEALVKLMVDADLKVNQPIK